ncbi:uncharacterized protein EI90DRAFT_3034226 [Cantharellus anzutake]|uniref:uncharacterized protein n=1 Tax=Cantharellus anzutake TaxID=1750568 RepID=UPI001906B479|nr:uncharacterized protein EI90DRAFT_3034226 [Cantharellus anzutake]KAF8341525.1 hypothetical protein EI90DRAFT_3034226 [Cantharellus anzutake]
MLNNGILSLSDAKTRTIWTGDAVHQLAVLEMSPSDTIGIHQGVVLALVSSNLPGEAHKKFVRMYSLSSLCNLVTLMVNQPETVPVDLGRPTGWASAPPQAKRHRPASSITRILSILESPSSQKERRADQRYSNLATPSSSRHSRASSTPSHPSSSLSSGDPAWDIIDDLPLKWAKDYLPLAPAYLKLADGSVSKFELFQTDDRSKNGPSVLAVGAKNHIYIFESGKGERAFRFAKELYTPFTVAHMRFVYQSTNDGLLMSRHTVGPGAYRHNRNPSLTELTEARSISLRASCTSKTEEVFKTSSVFASQLCLFVSFGERAAIIGLSDSAVEEVSLRDDIPPPVSRPYSCDQSQDPATVGPWLPIAYLKFPSPPTSITKNDPEAIGIFTGSLEAVYILTKGRRTHILRSPLPNPASSAKALIELTWKEQPSEVKPRTCIHTELFINAAPDSRNTTQQLQLQLMAFNGTGIEVIEVPISAIQAAAQGEIAGQMSLRGKGKGRALPAPPGVEYVRAKMDLGGEATFLATGGQWDGFKGLGRLERAASTTSSVFGEDVRDRSGVYACYEKGPNDYRVFFIGDYAQGDELVEENDGF